jgi:hypothetical protein
MKSKEEIDELYHKLYSISIDGEDNLHYYSFVEGYIQCQQDMADKKYTEQDIIEAAYFFATYKIATSREVFDKDIYAFINSLNKQD